VLARVEGLDDRLLHRKAAVTHGRRRTSPRARRGLSSRKELHDESDLLHSLACTYESLLCQKSSSMSCCWLVVER